jgi:hypothetical protein
MKRLTLWAPPSGDNDVLILNVVRSHHAKSNNTHYILN